MKLALLPVNNGPFNCLPAREIELAPERILCNDVTLPWENNGNTRLYVLGNEFGAMGAVWATNDQDALDELVDAELGDGILIEGEIEKDMEISYVGNHGKPADLTYLWIQFANLTDPKLLCAFAEARGAGKNNLE